MRVLNGKVEPVTQVRYLRARRGGGTESALLTVEQIRVDTLPDGVDAVVLTGDLQGIAPSPYGGDDVLLGIALADHMTVWSGAGVLPPLDRTGVVLAGDLYSAPRANRRGASGEVLDVWLAFAAAGCAWIVGVAGNHDLLTAEEVAGLGGSAALLDGDCVEHGGIRFGGVSGVIGDPRRTDRRAEDEFLALLAEVGKAHPEVLVLHEGPPGVRREQYGNPVIGGRLADDTSPALTVCGHVHWDRPLARLGGGHVVNVDGRVVVLTR
ncbi:metallophosphoesterase family protein [Yinghuangia seranimata]|uniref:metallophosphoesterase family protein n=1 Tax=Yinghuangia seranimata TaxID=408067 RepID=UPI00248CE043|nr:metallophosphoesterase [Yinghuangia seranimata]MDI2125869.1 metallophosphoesterase [Yinghuangia seranimata]